MSIKSTASKEQEKRPHDNIRSVCLSVISVWVKITPLCIVQKNIITFLWNGN